MTIQPFGNRISVKPVVDEQVITDESATLNEYGEVIAIGSEVLKIKVGDMVGFSVFGIEKLIVEDEKYYFLPEDSEFLLCTITD